MSLTLSHLAEVIVSGMAERERKATVDALGLAESADLEHVQSVEKFAFHECNLANHCGYDFDGASRVDVVLWIRKDLAVALELKLGMTRLTRTRVDGELLLDCRTSHNGKRIAGNMMAILDRRLGTIASADGLTVILNGDAVKLSRNWFVVTRQCILDKWVGDSQPDFSQYAKCVTIGELIAAFGGKHTFNPFVRQLLDIDYFKEWIS
jgi:hypothetical protein